MLRDKTKSSLPLLIALLLLGVFLAILSLRFFPPHAPKQRPAQNTLASEFGSPPSGIANPAAVYCQELGYTYRLVEGAEGQGGVCVLPDQVCGDWEFLQGKCGAEHSYCARLGYQTQTLTDGRNPYSSEYAVCLSPDRRTIAPVTELFGLDLRIRSQPCEGASDRGSPVESLPIPTSTPSPGRPAPTQAQSAASGALQIGEAESPDAYFDWHNLLGADWLSPVRNQGICGSCWAFSALGIAEAGYSIVSDNPDLDLDLSEQYLVSDCDMSSGDCCGGYKTSALHYLQDHGVPDEACMPYIDESGCSCDGECSSICAYREGGLCSDATCSDRCSNWEDRLTFINSYGSVSSDPAVIKQQLITKGPLAASMGILGDYGGYWENDIYRCTNDFGTNHAVILVGFDDGSNSWIVRNSWGIYWGTKGYFKVGYGECSIENLLYYSEVILPPSPTPTSTATPSPILENPHSSFLPFITK